MPNAAEIISNLEKCIWDAHYSGCKYDFIDPAQDLCRRLREKKLEKSTLLALLHLIERSPDIDYGGPGPLGELLESHANEKHALEYEELLVDSVLRKPTKFTLHLVFRLANDSLLPRRNEYRTLLMRLSTEESLSTIIRDEASDCIKSLGG